MPEREKLRKGQARIQFVANSERIKELSAQGYDIFKIYSALRDEQLITMTYFSFHDNFTHRRGKSKKAGLASASPMPETFQVIPPSSAKSLRPEQAKPIALPQSMTPVVASSINPDDAGSRRKELQAIMDQCVKKVGQCWDNFCPDPEYQKEAERIAGRKE